MSKKTKGPGSIGLLEKLGFGAYSMSLDCTNNFISTFLLFFYTDVLGISPALAGTVTLISTIWDGVNDPIFGYIASNRRFKNREISRPYIKWFAIPTAVMFVMIFTAVSLPKTLLFGFAVLIYLIYDTFNTFNRIPAGSMTTLATADTDERISISVFSAGGSGVGVVIATLGCWPLINALSGVTADGRLIDPKKGFFWGGVVVAVVILVGSFWHYFTTKERVLPEEGNDQKVGLLEALGMLFGCREWVENTLYYLFYNFAIVFVTTSIVYYATHVLKDAGAVTIILAAYIFATLIALPFVGPIHRKLGRKKTMILSAMLLVVSKIYFIFFPTSMIAAIVNGVLIGFGAAFAINTYNLNRAESADIIYWKRDKRIENMISAISNTVSKLGVALCTFVIGLVLDGTGYNAELAAQPAGAIKAIEAFMGIVPMILAACMLVIAFTTRIEKTVAEMKAEKEA
jgi:GPH family glycoside/pentoside/hexuronide:cation symporter